MFIVVATYRNYTLFKSRKKIRRPKLETIYTCKSYKGYPFKSKYTTTKNLKSDDGMILRVNRSIRAEGTFCVLKQNMGFKRFFSRGVKNVTIEFYLLSFAYNIQKLHQKNQNNELVHHLHELKKFNLIPS